MTDAWMRLIVSSTRWTLPRARLASLVQQPGLRVHGARHRGRVRRVHGRRVLALWPMWVANEVSREGREVIDPVNLALAGPAGLWAFGWLYAAVWVQKRNETRAEK